jgi:hypothetical protein
LVQSLSSILENWKYNYSSSDDPEEYYSPLIESLELYINQFNEDPEIVVLLEGAVKKIKDEIEELVNEAVNEEWEREWASRSEHPMITSGLGRSIFDDVDE